MLLLTLVSWLSSCHKWVPLEPPIEPAIEESDPGTVRITLANGRLVTVKEPFVSGDSVVGTVEETYWERGKMLREQRATSIALSSVQKIEVRRADPLATMGTIIGVTLGTILVFWAVSCASEPNQIGC
jgi:hypothetical protein